ncbi:hypothetical protein EDC04DRAFT_2893445 [Pisolithus marmoratus]|nr:hypothetical protein EDC04DRAFT_2893445 [Pisolithus marmoratus]
MRLIDVVTMLDVETRFDEKKKVPRTTKVLKEFYGPDLAEKEYAILSHCWGVEKEGEQEVLFEDMKQLLIMRDKERKEIRGRTGYKKIVQTCRRAQKDGLEWVWIDTCCINKESSSELSEAINSMYKWYANAELCYAYLHDTLGDYWTNPRESRATPKWFSRGWTLQELIAPKVVHFLDRKWERIGDKAELAWALSEITGIPDKVLKEGLQKALSRAGNVGRPSVAQIMSWAADRTTTREEDRAYSLLGLLGVHMPMLYGEGKNAFRRLQLEIIRTSNDQSVFAWDCDRESGWSDSILADDPGCFQDCGAVVARDPEWFTNELRVRYGMADDELSKCTQEQLRTFTVTNDGIQIWLPTETFGLYTKVTLACWHSHAEYLITIRLVICGSTCCRIFGYIPRPKYPGKLEFKQHFLPYKETKYPSAFTFELQDQTLSHDGFVLDRVIPDGVEVKDGLVTLSSDIDFAAVAYIRRRDDTRFLVLLGYCSGRRSAFPLLNFEQDPESLRSRAFERLFNSNHEPTYGDPHLMQHIHFCQSIEGVRVVYRTLYDWPVRCTVIIDIAKCAGCCTLDGRSTYDLVETPRTPGLMWNCLLYELPQTRDMSLSLMESELQPGDYGRVPQGGDKFRPEGNIIEFAAGVGLDAIEDDIRSIHSAELAAAESKASIYLNTRRDSIRRRLDLYDGTSWSIPANQQVVSLLHALSSRLSGRLLVTTVIRCSDPCRGPRLYSTTRRGEFDMSAWQTLDTPTPLCSVMMPLIWREIDLDQGFMTMLLKIIDNFSGLVGWVDRLDEPKQLTESATVETAIEFFVRMFGGGDIRYFIGEIVFFRELPRIMGLEYYTELDAGMDGRYSTQDISGSREVTVIAHAQRINALVAFLKDIDDGTFGLQLNPESDVQVGSRNTGWMTIWKSGSRWRSAPFAAQVLELIAAAYGWKERKGGTEPFGRLHCSLIANLCSPDIEFDRCGFLSEVEQIKKWQEMLIRSNDVHERRALVEDTVGKILLACWRGVASEIVRVLREVLDRYVNNEAMEQQPKDRAPRLYNIRWVLKDALKEIPDDGLNPMRRILDDATHGVLKHQLLLAERAELASQSDEARHTLQRKRD